MMGVIDIARRRKGGSLTSSPSSASTISATRANTDPPLTRVAQPMRQMGENAVRVLLDILNGGNGAGEQVTLPHTLVVRASTAPPGRW